MKVEIVILGSGAGFAANNRSCTSIALLVEPDLYLFDCGEPASAALRKAGIDVGALRALFISHMHADHVGGLPQLVSAVSLPARGPVAKFKPWSVSSDDPWYRNGLAFPKAPVLPLPGVRRRLEVHMPGAGIAPIRNLLEAVYLDDKRLPFDLGFTAAEAGEIYRDAQVAVTAAPNRHLDANPSYRELPAERRQSFSYRIDAGGKSVVFSGDVGGPEDLAPLLRGRVDLLIMEVAHYDPTGLHDFFAGFDIGQIVLSHIHPGLETSIAELVGAWNDAQISIAMDGTRIAVN